MISIVVEWFLTVSLKSRLPSALKQEDRLIHQSANFLVSSGDRTFSVSEMSMFNADKSSLSLSVRTRGGMVVIFLVKNTSFSWSGTTANASSFRAEGNLGRLPSGFALEVGWLPSDFALEIGWLPSDFALGTLGLEDLFWFTAFLFSFCSMTGRDKVGRPVSSVVVDSV